MLILGFKNKTKATYNKKSRTSVHLPIRIYTQVDAVTVWNIFMRCLSGCVPWSGSCWIEGICHHKYVHVVAEGGYTLFSFININRFFFWI